MKQVIVNKWLTSTHMKRKLQIGPTIGCLSTAIERAAGFVIPWSSEEVCQ
jgi:hypothetical protein